LIFMNTQTSRSIIVAGGMAVVVGIGVVAFALRSHPASVARAPLSPTPAAQVPDAASAPVAEISDVPGVLDQIDVGSTQSPDTAAPIVVQPTLAPNRHASKAGTSSVATEDTTPPTDSNLPADEQETRAGAQLADSDSQITTDVKSQIAGDSLSKDANIEVTTSQGIVALSGSLPSQDAIDHVKDVAGRVKDVRSVDTSALLVASR
jgi:hypothetical protein